MKKKIFVLFSLLLVFSMLFTACAQEAEETPEVEETEEPEETTGIPIGIVLPTRDEPRWIQDQTRFQNQLAELGYDAEILFSQADPSQEKSNVESLITQGVEVIILCPHDSAAAAASAEAAREAGVTIISYDRLITDTDAVDYYVTFDSVAVGEAQAQYLVDQAEGEGNPLYLYAGAATDNNAFLFFEGAWNVLQPKIADGTFYIVNSSAAVELQDKPELTRDEMGQIIGQVTTNWDFDDAKSLAEANLTAASAEDKGDVFILAPNDGTARAIADAFSADTDVTSYAVTGQDAEIASVQYIIDGKQSMTVLKDVRNLVDDAIEMAVSVVEGETVETTGEYDNGEIMVPAKQSEVITVTAENVQETIIDSGYWDASEFTGLDEVAEPEAPAELSIGIVLPTRDEPRWIQDQTRFQNQLDELGYDVEILFSQADPSQEKANVESLITQGVEVIILCPHDSAAAAASAEAAREAGVTIISYDRLITDTEAVDYYVTFDSVAVGEAQAQYLVDQAEGEGNPLYMYAGAATDNNAFLFFEGAWNVLQPKIADGTFYIVNSSAAVELQDQAELTRDEMGQIISQVTTNWDFDDAKSLAEANLTAASAEDKGDVFILAPNDGTARAIADAFAADTDVTSYVVTGQDAEIASVQYIIDGKQSMTVLKDVRNLVDDAIDMAISVVQDEPVETTGEYDNGVIMVPAKQSEVITVDQSNVQETIIDSGYWDASEFTGLE